MMRMKRNKTWVTGIGIVGICTFLCFLSAIQFQFTNWDDQFLVTQNLLIRSFTFPNLIAMFTSFSVNHYHPLVTLSYAIEYALVGLQPWLYHCTNIIIHAANAMLVVMLLQMLCGDKIISLVGGLVFAFHPLRVESVAWVAERKDVLSAFFILLALIMYIRSRNSSSPYNLVVVLVFMLAALLSKAIAVVLPVLFLLYDYYYDGKITKQMVMEKIPFFILSLLFGIIAVIAQYSTGARASDPHFHIFQSLFLSFYDIVFYTEKIFLPFNLSPVYPYPEMIHASYPMLFWLSPICVLIIAYLLYPFSHKPTFTLCCICFFDYVVAGIAICSGGACVCCGSIHVSPINWIFTVDWNGREFSLEAISICVGESICCGSFTFCACHIFCNDTEAIDGLAKQCNTLEPSSSLLSHLCRSI